MRYFITDILIEHRGCKIQYISHMCESFQFLGIQSGGSRIYYIGYRCSSDVKDRDLPSGVRVYKLGNGRSLFIVDKCLEHVVLGELDVVLLNQYIRDWKPVVSVLVRGTSHLKRVLKHLYTSNLRPFVIGMRGLDSVGRSRISKRQEQVLVLAYSRGFFNKPRGTTLLELSRELNITAATLNEIIRIGVRKLIERYLIDNGLLSRIGGGQLGND